MATIRAISGLVSLPEHQFNLQSRFLVPFNRAVNRANSYSRFRVRTQEGVDALERVGITVGVAQESDHAHAVSQTIEAYILDQTMPSYFKREPRFTVFGLKEHKANALANATGRPLTLSNPVLDPKDILRYPGNQGARLPPVQTRMLLIHDSAHHYTPADIANIFSASPDLESIVATVVIPPELLDDLRPMYPHVYTFEIKDNGTDFSYYPDGHVAGNYTQSMDCLWWLKTNRIVADDGTYTLKLVDSIYAHHTVLITRRTTLAPKYNSFEFPDRVSVPQELFPYFRSRYRSVDRKIYETAMSYVTSVGNVKLYQIKARIRMVANSLKHQHMLSDEFVCLQIAEDLSRQALSFIPEHLGVYHPWHNITRRGPIRWLRLLLASPSREAWEQALHRMDLPVYTANQHLGPIYVGADAPRSPAFTLRDGRPSIHQNLLLLKHILSGARGQVGPTLLGGNVGQPFFSSFYADLILATCGNYLLRSINFAPVTRALIKHTPRLLGVNRLMWCGPPLALAAFSAPILAARAYAAAHSILTGFLHAIELPNLLPGTLQTAYYTVKMANADVLLDDRPATTVTVDPSAPSTTHVPPGEVPHTDELPEEDHPAPPEPGPSPVPRHSPCDVEDCPQHDVTRSPWNPCAAGHGANVHAGALCHICRDTVDNSSPPAVDIGVAVPACHTPLDHMGVAVSDLPSSCIVRCATIHHLPRDQTCPHCLGDDFMLDAKHPRMPSRFDCLFQAVADASGVDKEVLWELYSYGNGRAAALSASPAGTNEHDAHYLACRTSINLTIITPSGQISCGVSDGQDCTIHYKPGHYYYRDTSLNGGHNAQFQKVPRRLHESLCSTWHTYSPSQSRAKALLSNLECGYEGYLLPRNQPLLKRLKSVCDSPPPRKPVSIGYIAGLPGTGKSHPVVTALKPHINRDSDFFRIVAHDLALRADIKQKLGPRSGYGYRIQTWELPFTGSYAKLMVIDDVGKFPPGYISLLIYSCPTIEHILVTGDPAQAVHHCRAVGNTLNSMTPEIDTLKQYMSRYLTRMIRPCCGVAHELGLPHECNDRKGMVVRGAQPRGGSTVLCSTDAASSSMSAVGHRSFTFSGSQGITITEGYEILVDKYALLADDRTWFTALTRGMRGIHLIMSTTGKRPQVASQIAGALLYGSRAQLQQAVAAHIRRYIPPGLLDPTKTGQPALCGGYGEHADADLAASQLPHLSGILDQTPEPSFPDAKTPDPSPAPISLPAGNFRGFYAMASHSYAQVLALVGICIQPVLASADRERNIYGGYTSQVDDRDDLTALFIRHARGDVATERWTIRERFVPPDGRSQRSQAALGYQLWVAYDRTFRPQFPEFNPAVWEDCAKRDQDTFLAKGSKALAAISDRACPEWLINEAELFMKGQSVTKPGTIGRDAKKGQLIVSFCTELNFRFGRLAKYMAWAVSEAMPPHIYTLDGHTDVDTSSFVRDNWDFSRDSSEDDYEGFDSTQGHEFQVFDAHLMRAAHIPEEEIEFYMSYITSIETFLGLLGPMMASGFKFTLLFNTERSKSYQALKYVIRWLVACMFTGDDVAINDTPPESPAWAALGGQFRLISKRAVSQYPTFCGWVLSPVCVYKRPELLLHRTAYQLARDNLPRCIYNYMADITPLAENLEALSPYLTADDLMNHYTNLDILRAEARRCGIRTFGSFMTSFGTTRNYSLLGGHSINSPTMSYTTISNSAAFERAQAARWCTYSVWVGLERSMQRCDYSVIDSRRDAHAAILDFIDNQMYDGSSIFGSTVRFPVGLKVSDFSVDVDRLINNLISVLSFRSSNVAKDTEQSRGGASNRSDVAFTAVDQATQDNTKRFEELRKQMREVTQWGQRGFEESLGLVWA